MRCRQWLLWRGAGDPIWVVNVVGRCRAEALSFGDDGALGGFFAAITGHEPAGDGGGLPGGEGEAVVAEELRGEQLLGAKGHLILHEVVPVSVVGVDVGGDGEVGELVEKVWAVLAARGAVMVVIVGRGGPPAARTPPRRRQSHDEVAGSPWRQGWGVGVGDVVGSEPVVRADALELSAALPLREAVSGVDLPEQRHIDG